MLALPEQGGVLSEKENEYYKGCLFIYNENFRDFLNKASRIRGSGNGVARLARADYSKSDPRAGNLQNRAHLPEYALWGGRAALGIPTGPNFTSLDKDLDKSMKVQNIIDDSIEQIVTFLVSNPQFHTVYYTRMNEDDEDSGLGASIFSPDKTVLKYITDQIKGIPNKVKQMRDELGL